MIWVRGSIVPDEALAISVLDRTFEHGLGLFETLRTWKGHPSLLDRHLARMARSARELGLPLDREQLPDRAAVAALLSADHREGDAMVRIILSGGLSASHGSTVWMRSFPLPSPPERGLQIGDGWSSDDADSLAAYKSLNYWGRKIAYEQARSRGLDEVVSVTGDCCAREGSRTNIFLIRGNRVETPMLAPPDDRRRETPVIRPIVPGIMRAVVLERAPGLDLEAVERHLDIIEFEHADEVFLTNSVRGILPVARFGNRTFEAPGPVTRRLWDAILPWLESGGTTR